MHNISVCMTYIHTHTHTHTHLTVSRTPIPT